MATGLDVWQALGYLVNLPAQMGKLRPRTSQRTQGIGEGRTGVQKEKEKEKR